MSELSEQQYFVNCLRSVLGKAPLYSELEGKNNRLEACGSYVSKEIYCKLADPACKRCGGSGYYAAEQEEQTCNCTGLPRRMGSGQGRRKETLQELFNAQTG